MTLAELNSRLALAANADARVAFIMGMSLAAVLAYTQNMNTPLNILYKKEGPPPAPIAEFQVRFIIFIRIFKIG